MGRASEIVVAGHICLDLIPTLPETSAAPSAWLRPGALVEVGPAVTAIGGVANTAVALCRLGTPPRLICKTGDDLFGRAIREHLRELDPHMTEGLVRTAGAASSYTVVLSPPQVDRMFLHCPGANETFGADDIAYGELSDARVLHFGYPPLMKKLYEDGGREAERIFRGVREQGLLVSLDMTLPDRAAPAGRVDWRAWLERTLPQVDLFMPSLDELLFMLEPSEFGRHENMADSVDATLLERLSAWVLGAGVAFVAIKLGEHGLYLRTTARHERLACLHKVLGVTKVWCNRELYAPCFVVDVAGTTGSGDSTVAGFVYALAHGCGPQGCMEAATAVGACSVERLDATGGVPRWEDVQRRLAGGWQRRAPMPAAAAWNEADGCRVGPRDRDRAHNTTTK